jgi:glycosyltransferase involved in cell wall biosynthesis
MVGISVLMCIHSEEEEWLIESIESVLSQSYSNFEFIIVNDNPIREINKKILEYYSLKDLRISVINNEINLGLTKSLNIGLRRSKGKYVARMDADDISFLNRFSEQFEFMESNENVVLCGTQVRYIGSESKKKISWIKKKNIDLKQNLIWGSVFVHPTVFIRSSVLKLNNIFYDEYYLQAQDYSLWVDLINFGDFYNIQKILLGYRKSDKQISFIKKSNQLDYSRKIRLKLINNKMIQIGSDFSISDKEFFFEDIKKLYNELHKKNIIDEQIINIFQVMFISLKYKSFFQLVWICFISFRYNVINIKKGFRLIKSCINETKYI